MKFVIVDPASFLEQSLFREDTFVSKVKEHNWDQYRDCKVLVRGCNSTVIPPWAFMLITAHLTGTAKSVRYGNEHDNITVYRLKDSAKL